MKCLKLCFVVPVLTDNNILEVSCNFLSNFLFSLSLSLFLSKLGLFKKFVAMYK